MDQGQNASDGGQNGFAAIKRIIACIIALMMPLFFAGFAFARTATTVEQKIADKMLYQGVYRCYTDGYIVSSFNPIDPNYQDVNSFVTNKAGDENYVPLITGLNSSNIGKTATYKVSDSGLSCKQFIVGGHYFFGGSNKSILEATNHIAPQIGQPEQVEAFLKNMGYSIENLGSGGADSCFALKYTDGLNSGTQMTTNPVCQNSAGNLYVNAVTESYGGIASSKKIRFDMGSGTNEVCFVTVNLNTEASRGCKTLQSGEVFNGAWLQSIIKTACGGPTCSIQDGSVREGTNYDITFVDNGVDNTESLASKKASFINNNPAEAAMQAIRFLFNTNIASTGDILFSRAETRLLYQDYLTTYYKVKVVCGASSGDLYQGQIWWYNKSSKSMEQCYYYGTNEAEHVNDPVNGVQNSMMQYENIANLDALLGVFVRDELGHEYSESELEEMSTVTNSGTYQNIVSENGNGDDPCRDNSGSLGWIVCPVITWVGDTLNTVYESMVEPFLKINPTLVSSEGGTYQAWEVFRNVANIVFVVLFLVVIFSQLTGVGIDNYGIKKILPKLIITAILINLSYIICQLAVDLSNIFGSGINVALSNIASGLPSNMAGAFDSGSWFKHVLNGLLAVAGAGGVGAIALTISGGLAVSGLILPLLFGLFTALISVICFFALLGMRQAAVIVLVAIAPLAFVCYMLPNTKKLFDSWLKIFKGLLLLYPLCGLVIGGSALASKVIISTSTDFFVYLIGLLILVVPFFFIPTLLKNSFSALGNIGAKFMNAGNRFGRRAASAGDKAVRSSKLFQEREQMRVSNANKRRAENIRDRINSRIDRGLGEKDRKDLQALREKLRSGESLSADEKKQYDELIGKSNYKLSAFQQKRLSDANATIRESEANRQKALIGSNEAVLAGQIQSDRYMNERAAEEALDWNEQYFVDNKNNEWVSDGKGNYVTSANGVKMTKTAAEIDRMVREKEGVMVSRREAMLHRDAVMRARQTAQIAGYANEKKVDMAASGARVSSVEASRAEVARDALSGDDNVLRVQHDENMAKLNETIGKAKARGALTESPVASTEVYARRAANEYNLAQAGNRIEVTPEITRQYAESLATQRFNTSQERMYSEQLTNNSRAQSLADLAGAIRGSDVEVHNVKGSSTGVGHTGDINYIMAAIKDVVAKGGIEDLNNLIKNSESEIGGNPKVARVIGSYMATMSIEPVMKAYGKAVANIPEGDPIPSYKHWLDAADDPVGDKDGKLSLAGFIRANGNTVLVNASKDTAKFYNADPALMDKFSAVQIWNGMLSARDNDTRNAFNSMLIHKIEHGTAQDGTTGDAAKNKIRQEAIDAASNAQWANIEESSFKALLGLSESDDLGTAFSRLDPALQKSFRDAKARLDKAGGTVKANMRGKVRDFFDSVK